MAAPLETRSDCSRCAALCCIAYPSDEMPGFSAAKDAGEPCPKLSAEGLCTIYEDREAKGFAGCIRFECFGAGQHVVQHLFAGRDWRDDPTLLGPMIETFLAMRPVSDLAFLIERARPVAPGEAVAARFAQLDEELRDIADTREGLADTARITRAENAVRRAYATLDPAAVLKQ